MKFIFFSLLLFSTFFCNSNNKQKLLNNKKVDTAIIDKSISNDTFIKNSIDTAQYFGLPYYDTTMYHPGSQGYIDTFTIHNTKLRIVHQDTMFDGIVEIKKNGQWYRNMQFENLGNQNDYDISQDLDGDGYKDLIFYWKWYGEIHFFDTTKNEFCDTANSDIGRDWALLDTINHIFYENEFGKLMHSPISSNLFTFKKAKRIDIAKLKITFNPNDEDEIFINGALFLNKSKTPIEKVIPKEKISVIDFDYKTFWKEHYKKIISSD